MRFQTKLYAFFFVTVIVPIVAATLVAAYLYPHVAVNEIRDRQLDRVESAASLLASRSEIIAAEGTALLRDEPSRVNSLLSGDNAVIEPALTDLMGKTGASQAKVTDPAGNVLARVTAPGIAEKDGPAACSASAEIPLKMGGTVQGNLIISRNLDPDFEQYLLQHIGDESAMICGGRVVASNFTAGNTADASLAELSQPGAGKGTADEASLAGREYLTYAHTVQADPNAAPIMIVTGETRDQITSRLAVVVSIGAGLAFFTLGVAAILAWLVTRSITNPLHVLTRAALRIEAGDFDNDIEVRSRDEVGVLATTFQQMSNRIRDYIAQLKESRERMLRAISTTSDTLGSSYDREGLLGVVTESAALATHADRARFYLIEHDGLEPEIRLAKSIPDNGVSEITEPVFREAVREVARGHIKGLAITRNMGKQILVAPVLVKHKPMGALLLESENCTQPLEAGVCDIIQSLAIQASTAIENVELNEALQEMVITDALTGLRNVRYFNERLIAETESAGRQGSELSLIVIDLDKFKSINDKYGHLVGDEVLRQVGKLLRENVRKSDVSVRYGGEEFAIILPHTSKSTAIDVAEKLRAAAASLRITDFPDIEVRFSAGVAAFPADARETQELVRRADDAAYQAKESGRDRTVAA